jgi:hypothetical protein
VRVLQLVYISAILRLWGIFVRSREMTLFLHARFITVIGARFDFDCCHVAK